MTNMTSPLARLRQASVAEQKLPGPEGAVSDELPSPTSQENIVNKPTNQQTNKQTNHSSDSQSDGRSDNQTKRPTNKQSGKQTDPLTSRLSGQRAALSPIEAALIDELQKPLRKVKAGELVLIGGRVHPDIKARLESVAMIERRSYQTIIEEGLKLYFAEVARQGLHEDEE